MEVARHSAPPKEHFRTDAKAQGSELWVGGWCCADDANPRNCRWFSEKIDHLKFPLFFMSGQSYRSIGALEMLATLIAVLLFELRKALTVSTTALLGPTTGATLLSPPGG